MSTQCVNFSIQVVSLLCTYKGGRKCWEWGKHLAYQSFMMIYQLLPFLSSALQSSQRNEHCEPMARDKKF